jgi:hypothetical protein
MDMTFCDSLSMFESDRILHEKSFSLIITYQVVGVTKNWTLSHVFMFTKTPKMHLNWAACYQTTLPDYYKLISGEQNKTDLLSMGTVKAAIPHLSSADAATRRSSVMLVNSLAQLGAVWVSLILESFIFAGSSLRRFLMIMLPLKYLNQPGRQLLWNVSYCRHHLNITSVHH